MRSERRASFGENSLLGFITRTALDAGLSVVLWVGETSAEREAYRTTEIVNGQFVGVVAVALRVTEGGWACVPAPLPLLVRGGRRPCGCV